MTISDKKIMVAGHICLDIMPKFENGQAKSFGDIFSPGKLINVGDAVISTGGAVSNTGLAMAKLGIDVKLNGKVGDDCFGGLIINLLGKERSQTFRVVKGHSSYTIVLAVPGLDRVFLHNPGANDTFTSDDIDYDALKGCCLFHFGYPTLMRQMYINEGDELVKVFKKAKDCGVITSLDMTLPDSESESGKVDWRLILRKIMPYVDIFLPSMEEITYMLNEHIFNERKSQAGHNDPVLVYNASDCTAIANELISMGAGIVAIKNGIKGYYLRTAPEKRIASISGLTNQQTLAWSDREIWSSSYKAEEFASATGAGDATIAGFLTAVIKGFGPIETLEIANTLGWQNVRKRDALSGIEDWTNTLRMIKDKNRPRNLQCIDDNGWIYYGADKVFLGPHDSNNMNK